MERQLLTRKFVLFLALVALAGAPMSVNAAEGKQPTSTEQLPQKLTLKLNNVTLVQAIKAIENNSDYIFVYQENVIANAEKCSIDVKDADIADVLEGILPADVFYKVSGRQILLGHSQSELSQTAKPATPAKKREIRGSIKDIKNDEPMMFVTVSIKGTTNGTMSDTNGRFTISAAEGETILFQILGYESQELLVTADLKNPVVIMREESVELEGTVVTALGITRDEKSVGYAVSKIDNDKLSTTVSNNWVNGLDGKVAGLNFESASTGPGGSVRATIRGEGSLSHDKNEVLFVIDGVPMISGMVASSDGSGYDSADAPVDFGNAAGDLNPDDIASVTVLKGPAATALYGSQAANGAIVITTKSGKDSDKKLRVDFNSSVVFEQAGYWPEFQDEYGAGNGNATGRLMQTYYSFWTVPAEMSDNGQAYKRQYSRLAFGPRFEGQMFYNYNSANWVNEDGEWYIGSYTKTPWVAQDWYKGAFQTGYTTSNTVAVSYNPDKNTSIRFSLNDKRNDWILPNNGYTSQNFSLSMDQQAGKRVKLSAKVTYYRKDADNLPTTGYNTASPMYSLMHNTPSTAISSYKDEYFSGRMDYLLQTRYDLDETIRTRLINYQSDNLYMILYGHTNSLDRDRIFGNASVNVDIVKGLSFLVRSGVDLSTDFRTQRKSTYSYAFNKGMYKEQTVRDLLTTTDALLTYKTDFNKSSWYLNATLGASTQYRNLNNVQLIADRIDKANVFILQNSIDAVRHSVSRSNKKINSLFGTISVSYKDMVFLDITGRNDWSSALGRGNWSYFYPSVSAAVLIDKMIPSIPKWVDIIKVRGSWANVGNDTDPYNLTLTYSNSAFPSSYVFPSVLQNAKLKPENVMSWESGIQASFFKKRIGFDLAGYYSATTDQIITVPTDYITGASAQYINAGKVTNTGIELSINAMPIYTKHVKWTVDFNWAKNWNKLVELADGVEVWQMNTNTVGNRVYIYAYPGTELGRIYGQGYKRAPKGAYYIDADGNKVSCEGQKVIDSSTGFPQLSGTATTDILDFGSIYPDWKGGLSTSLSVYGVRLSMNFTFQKGGNAYSITHFGLSSQGKLTNSLEGRYEGLLLEGVVDNGDGTYSPNTTIISDIVDYYTTYKYSRNNVEENVFDTSFLKFKELRLDYSIPRKALEKTKVITGISFGFFATNLFCVSNFPLYDPEVATMTGASISRGIEACAYPMTRTYGLNLKLAF